MAFLMGHDPGLEQKRHPTMGRLDEGIWDRRKTDDPVRHERLAAIGKNGTRFAFIKRMTSYFVYHPDRKTMRIETEMTQFSPIIYYFVVVVTLSTYAQMAYFLGLLCRLNKNI